MTGRAEVHRLRQALDHTFSRAAAIGPDTELQSDFARYLCVLVSGFLENAIVELILEHARRHSHPSIQRFVEYRSRKIANVNCQRLLDILGTFDPGWRNDLEKFLLDERQAAVDCIVAQFKNTYAMSHSLDHPSSTYNPFKFVFEHRLEKYRKTSDQLSGTLVNMVILVALGILLLFYRPGEIDIPFMKLKVPEGI